MFGCVDAFSKRIYSPCSSITGKHIDVLMFRKLVGMGLL